MDRDHRRAAVVPHLAVAALAGALLVLKPEPACPATQPAQQFRRTHAFTYRTIVSDLQAILTHPGNRPADRARIAGGPAAGIHLRQEIADNAVELVGILRVDAVAAIRHHRERGGRYGLLYQYARPRQGQSSSPVRISVGTLQRLHLVRSDRRATAARAARRAACCAEAERRMFGQLALEFGETARILVLELHARRAEGVARGERLPCRARE